MNTLDWILLVLVLAYALSGYWQGFITGAFATTGLLLGGYLGVLLVPIALGKAEPKLSISIAALFIVIVMASLGQAMLQFMGARVRDRIKWRPVRFVDALGGAALSAVAVLLIAWALGVAVSGIHLDGVTREVRGSVVLAKVNNVVPDSANRLLGSFDNVVGANFPRYLEPFEPEHIVDVGPGPARLKADKQVKVAAQSVLKVHGASKCGRGIEGSGWVVRPDYVLTNAHVVAGVSNPSVIINGHDVAATVVQYDSKVDLALLHVDTGALNQLALDVSGRAGEGVAILGYPQDGPLDLEAARIRAEQRLRSPDIYGHGSNVRDVFSLRGLVRPGNSGGPIVDGDGRVVGVVFAASVTDSDTGYALTGNQITPFINDGVGKTSQVSTGACAD